MKSWFAMVMGFAAGVITMSVGLLISDSMHRHSDVAAIPDLMKPNMRAEYHLGAYNFNVPTGGTIKIFGAGGSETKESLRDGGVSHCMIFDGNCNMVDAGASCTQPDPESETAKNLDRCLGGHRYTGRPKP